ncbi:hypothetical protein [Micromonospora sp. NPDC005299]|uniref:hypothetical protein n=1 Tax=Micromonospora sp. NPDC005299 TaxID=3364231 RepID=UPI0036A3B7C5
MFDLDAVAAEETKAPLTFTWHGQEWTLAHMTGVDWRVVELANEGDVEAIRKAFRLAMGAEQADRFDELPQPIAAMTALFKRWLDHNGTTEGESTASPDSSGSTAGPSKRPSKRTTRASGSGTSSRGR